MNFILYFIWVKNSVVYIAQSLEAETWNLPFSLNISSFAATM